MDLGVSDYGRMPSKAGRPRLKLQLGAWIRWSGKKQVVIAKAAGITESHLGNIKSGKIKKPDPIVLVKLSDAIGCTVNDLYTVPPPADQPPPSAPLTPAENAKLRRILQREPT